jgi:hypothetical protein
MMEGGNWRLEIRFARPSVLTFGDNATRDEKGLGFA